MGALFPVLPVELEDMVTRRLPKKDLRGLRSINKATQVYYTQAVFHCILLWPSNLDADMLETFLALCAQNPNLVIETIRIWGIPSQVDDIAFLYQHLAVVLLALRDRGTVRNVDGPFSHDMFKTVRHFLCRPAGPSPRFTIHDPKSFGTQGFYHEVTEAVVSANLHDLRLDIPCYCEPKDRLLYRRLILPGINILTIRVDLLRMPEFFLQFVVPDVRELVIEASLEGTLHKYIEDSQLPEPWWLSDASWDKWVTHAYANTARVWKTCKTPLDLRVVFRPAPSSDPLDDCPDYLDAIAKLDIMLAECSSTMWASRYSLLVKSLGR